MRRPFRLNRPTTWPRWFWYAIVAPLWCLVIASTGAALVAAVSSGEYSYWTSFWQIFLGAFGYNVCSFAWTDFKHWRDAS